MLDTIAQEDQGVLQERLVYLVYGTVWFLFAFWIAVKNQLLDLPEERFKSLPSNFLRHMIGAFLVFFFIEFLLLPIHLALWLKYQQADKMTPYVAGWMTMAGMVFAAMGVLFYYFFLPFPTKKIVQGGRDHRFKDFLAGVMTWFFAAPIILIVSQLMALMLPLITDKVQLDQNVVKHMKEMTKYPALFAFTAVGVVTFVPIVEEILFRGFLQSWLFDILGRTRSILLTSVIFAGFHFSFSQGIFNIELLISLFILSCFLGFIYEKKGSIWASIGLHFIFNLVSICMIAFGSV